ncbi:TetR/AcrR family transcriptional regulator [Chryseobacterium sp. T20]|uniref:TetR/AcrR family transcriptional regulator n=1 Tax=Chryseobacterium sp. T20 TaxID=3395375 RepID=UPI0039BCC566
MENSYGRKKDPEVNKQLIIDTATEIGAETDWHHVTFQAIADRTGLSKGGIIHHFRNKEELLDEVMNQNLSEISKWVENYKQENGDTEGALGYLHFVLEKGDDEKYQKNMKIVLQGIMANNKYREKWMEWYNQQISPKDKNSENIRETVIFLIVEGLWYTENMGKNMISGDQKKKILDYIKKMK